MWLSVGLFGCDPMTQLLTDSGRDLFQLPAPQDLRPSPDLTPPCSATAGNLARNPSFEKYPGGIDYADNSDNGSSSYIPDWYGCCTNTSGPTVTTTWSFVSDARALCPPKVIKLEASGASAARPNVFFQATTLLDSLAPGRPFELSAWVYVVQAGADAALWLDLYDLGKDKLGPERVIARSAPAALPPTGSGQWSQLMVSGVLPTYTPSTSPLNVQLRFSDSGTFTALLDDVVFVLR